MKQLPVIALLALLATGCDSGSGKKSSNPAPAESNNTQASTETPVTDVDVEVKDDTDYWDEQVSDIKTAETFLKLMAPSLFNAKVKITLNRPDKDRHTIEPCGMNWVSSALSDDLKRNRAVLKRLFAEEIKGTSELAKKTKIQIFDVSGKVQKILVFELYHLLDQTIKENAKAWNTIQSCNYSRTVYKKTLKVSAEEEAAENERQVQKAYIDGLDYRTLSQMGIYLYGELPLEDLPKYIEDIQIDIALCKPKILNRDMGKNLSRMMTALKVLHPEATREDIEKMPLEAVSAGWIRDVSKKSDSSFFVNDLFRILKKAYEVQNWDVDGMCEEEIKVEWKRGIWAQEESL
jgi:hypothetical protein